MNKTMWDRKGTLHRDNILYPVLKEAFPDVKVFDHWFEEIRNKQADS